MNTASMNDLASNTVSIKNRITKACITGKITEYYFVCKMSGGSWNIIYDPFIVNGDIKTGVSGEFISSTWFKHEVPQKYQK